MTVVGLYLDPPAKAVVVCVDEKSQMQALDRTAPIVPLRPGIPEKQTHDYKRNRATTLFAALEVATGLVTDRCFDRHTNVEFLAFLKQVARPTRGYRCTSSATTTPRTPAPTSRPGWPRTACNCTSRPPQAPG